MCASKRVPISWLWLRDRYTLYIVSQSANPNHFRVTAVSKHNLCVLKNVCLFSNTYSELSLKTGFHSVTNCGVVSISYTEWKPGLKKNHVVSKYIVFEKIVRCSFTLMTLMTFKHENLHETLRYSKVFAVQNNSKCTCMYVVHWSLNWLIDQQFRWRGSQIKRWSAIELHTGDFLKKVPSATCVQLH